LASGKVKDMADRYSGGMPSVDFSTLGSLGDVYNKNKNDATLANLAPLLQAGDWKGAAGLAAQAGRPDLSLQFLNAQEQRGQHGQANTRANQELELNRQKFEESKRQFNESARSGGLPQIVFQEDARGIKRPYRVDPRTGTVMPIEPGQPGQGPATIAPPAAPAVGDQSNAGETGAVPPGAAFAQAGGQPVLTAPDWANPKEYIKKASTEQAEADVKTNERGRAGDRVFQIVDQLEAKTKDKLFGQATGPAVEYAARQDMNSPSRLAYEYSALGPKKEAQAFLDQVKQDAQAISSELQRAYLSGQGSVTENERKAIDQILGNIAGARSPEAARALLKNLRTIIKTTFARTGGQQSGYVVPDPQGGIQQAPQQAAPDVRGPDGSWGPATAPQQPQGRVAPDGKTYIPDPNRPGKFLRVD
jgi:hypothetical protein